MLWATWILDPEGNFLLIYISIITSGEDLGSCETKWQAVVPGMLHSQRAGGQRRNTDRGAGRGHVIS